MMRKIAVILIILSLILTSCQLVHGQPTKTDVQLVGSFSTFEELYSIFPNQGDRIYAQKEMIELPGGGQSPKFSFPDLSGELSMSYTPTENFPITTNLPFEVIGTAADIVSAQHYYVAQNETRSLKIHPVYRTSDGQVFITVDSNSIGLSDTGQFSSTITETKSFHFQGKTEERKMEVKVIVEKQDFPTSLRISQFGADNTLIESQNWEIDSLLEEFKPLPETKFIVLTTLDDKESFINRSLITPDDKHLAWPILKSNSFISSQPVQLLWPNQGGNQ